MQKTKLVRNVAVLALIALVHTSAQDAFADAPKTRVLVCAPDTTIGDEIKHLDPGDTLLVSGTCNENVSITEEIHNVIIDGQGAVIINGPDASRNVVTIRGNGIALRGFNITGGNNGILVSRGGSAVIAGNVIEYVGNHGINVNQDGSVRIINNTIQNNPGDGILINENSSARIGFLSTTDGAANPNIVQYNGGQAVNVTRSSSARVVGNI